MKIMTAVGMQGIKADCYENICAVFIGTTQLIESTLTNAKLFKNSYYKDENGDLRMNTPEKLVGIRVVYYRTPELKKVENDVVTGGNVMVPIEFLELVKAKLKATMYRNANEDELAAKWTALYNVKLENFKLWCESKRPKFGIV